MCNERNPFKGWVEVMSAGFHGKFKVHWVLGAKNINIHNQCMWISEDYEGDYNTKLKLTASCHL